jgi:uncharacterized membrane protein
MVSGGVVEFFGMSYVVPVVREWPGTIIAINVGGALIPAILSFYLLFKNKSYLRTILAIAVVAIAVHWLAQPVRGVGISVPVFSGIIAVLLAPASGPPSEDEADQEGP